MKTKKNRTPKQKMKPFKIEFKSSPKTDVMSEDCMMAFDLMHLRQKMARSMKGVIYSISVWEDNEWILLEGLIQRPIGCNESIVIV